MKQRTIKAIAIIIIAAMVLTSVAFVFLHETVKAAAAKSNSDIFFIGINLSFFKMKHPDQDTHLPA